MLYMPYSLGDGAVGEGVGGGGVQVLGAAEGMVAVQCLGLGGGVVEGEGLEFGVEGGGALGEVGYGAFLVCCCCC